MLRDVRQTPEAQAVQDFYTALFSPGSGRTVDARDAVYDVRGDAILFTGLTFETSLEAGPSPHVYRANAETGVCERLFQAPAHSARPSPTGDAVLCVTANPDGPGDALVLLAADGAATTSPADGVIELAEWSPDGSSILLLIAGLGADVAGYQGGFAMTAPAADGPDWLPEVSTGDAGDLWRRLYIHDIAGGARRQVSAQRTNVWEASWCGPDTVVVIRGDSHSEADWYKAQLAAIDLASGAETELYRGQDQLGLPVGSPDGRRVAFVEAVASDRGIICGTLKILDRATGDVSAASLGDVEVTSVSWRDADIVHFAGQSAFDTVVGDYVPAAAASREIWRSATQSCGEWYASSRPAPDGGGVLIVESYDTAPALAIVSDGAVKVVCSFATETGAAAARACGRLEPARWLAPDGLEIHGWLARPERLDGPAPLVLDIHGGPVWANRNRWVGRLRTTGLLVRRGTCVLFPNPRGSSTRGQAFAALVRGDMCGADTHDCIAALDHFIDEGLADPARLACTGSSYGGLMSAWLVTQDQRFAAAAPISPVTNWYSQHRTSQIPFFDELFLEGSPWEPGGRYFERSPVMFANRARTPCLVLAGALDKNTPPGQALEFHQSLLESGVESVLTVYPKAGHSLRSYPAYLDSAARILIWFGRFL